MKKLWTERDGRERNRRHAQSSAARSLHWKKWRRTENASHNGTPAPHQHPHHRPPTIFVAPAVLSAVDAPESAVEFFGAMQRHTQQRDVFVDLSNVVSISPDSIALLVAMVKLLGKRRGIRVRGNYPEEDGAKTAIKSSGFDQYVTSSNSGATSRKGTILRRDMSMDSTKADGEYAAKLIDFAMHGRTARTGGLRASYNHLIECMSNTHQHAAKRPGTESWCASVYRDAARRCDCFTFVDIGVGIFNSVELSIRLKLFNLIGQLRSSILRQLFEGKIPSSTRKVYRGRGLPSIYRSCVIEKKIRRFVTLTNDVYGDTSTGRFATLRNELKGVVLYWEVPL